MNPLFKKENNVCKYETSVSYNEDSIERFFIPKESTKYRSEGLRGLVRLSPIVISNVINLHKAIDTLKKNPSNPKKKITKAELKDVENYAKQIGIDLIGYAKVEPQNVFKEKCVLHENAIVLGMEMNKEKMDTTPSFKAIKEVMHTYNKLGILTNKLTKYLRKLGFAAHARHPLGGISLYPPLAQAAGLAWLGYSGLMISPEFGPRFRISAIYTNIENLPFAKENKHSWIEDYCKKCRKCIRSCPGKAILDEPIIHSSGRITHIIQEKCMPHFTNEYGCSICLKVCPFNNKDYYEIKKNFESKKK